MVWRHALWMIFITSYAVGGLSFESDCPERDGLYVKYQTCNCPCRNNDDCLGLDESCLCDGRCGLSCIRLDDTVGCYAPSHPHPQGAGITVMEPIPESLPVALGHRATVRCWLGELIGPATITCMANGQWSNNDFQCIKYPNNENFESTSCNVDELKSFNNSIPATGSESTEYTAGDRVTYVCEEGYRMLGPEDSVTCLNDGSWSNIQIECILATCGDPGIPEHATLSTYNFNVGSGVAFICYEGYELRGDSSRTCSVDGLSVRWSPWINGPPVCEPLSCDPLVVTQDSKLSLDVDGFLVGAVAYLECDYGYRLEGETSIYCMTNQQWSSGLPTCQKITCVIPNHSEDLEIRSTRNARLRDGDEVDMDQSIIYACSDRSGKQLHGEEVRTCQLDSEFSGSEPSCHAPCHDVPHVPNPQTVCWFYPDNVPSTRHGSVLLYFCNTPGYYLEGVSRFECVDGTWEPHSPDFMLNENHPICVPVLENQDEYLYSIRTPLQYGIGSNFKYYLTVVEGSTAYIECLTDSPPQLKPYWLKFVPEHDRNNPVGSNLNYDNRYGFDAIRATDNTWWHRLILYRVTSADNGEYKCAGVYGGSFISLKIGNPECFDPGTPINGYRHPPHLTLPPYRFYFYCNPGYRMIGSSWIACSRSIDNEWTSPVPVCEKIVETCADKTYPNWNGANGFSEITYTINDEVDEARHSFFCNIGYELSTFEATYATCHNESRPQWLVAGVDDLSISCIQRAINVELLPPPVNRRYYIYDVIGGEILCRPENNHTLDQISWKVQDSNGQLINVSTDPTQRIYSVINATGAYLVFDDPERLDSGEYACVYSTDVTSYTAEVVWITFQTTCSDPRVLIFPNGNVLPPPEGMFYQPEETVMFSCNEGYVLLGPSEWTCESDGNWYNNRLPVCIPDVTISLYLGAANLPNQTNMYVKLGQELAIDCTTGSDVTYLDQRKEYGFGWYKIDHGGVRLDDHIEQFISMDGTSKRLFLPHISMEQGGIYACGTHATWIIVYFDVVIPCPDLPNPIKGRIENWSSRKDAVVTYTCMDGYELNITEGNQHRTCLKSGVWNGTEPSCSIAECPPLSAPVNGKFTFDPVTFGLNEVVEFTCDRTYKFSDDASRSLLCQSDGSWNTSVPTCISKCSDVSCGPGEKCLVNADTEEAECICKDTSEDCSIEQPVCADNAKTYSSLCALEVTACVENITISKVADEPCKNRGLCSSHPISSSNSSNCDPRNLYYYSSVLMKCTDTSGGLCMAEGTGFPTREDCDSVCSATNYCYVARDPGPCNQEETRWAWDFSSSNSASHTCVEFTYGGCQGNENNFRSYDECLLTCPDRCQTCPKTTSLCNACYSADYAIKANLLQLSRFEKTPSRTFPTTFHIRINDVLKTSPFVSINTDNIYDLWSTVTYRSVSCPCPMLLALETEYMIIPNLQIGPSRSIQPIVTDETYVELWSEDLECELRCTATCNDMAESLGLPVCPHPGNPICDCCIERDE